MSNDMVSYIWPNTHKLARIELLHCIEQGVRLITVARLGRN